MRLTEQDREREVMLSQRLRVGAWVGLNSLENSIIAFAISLSAGEMLLLDFCIIRLDLAIGLRLIHPLSSPH